MYGTNIYLFTEVITPHKAQMGKRYRYTPPNNRDVVGIGNGRSILRNKALFMSLFAFDVILLSALYVTMVLMAK